MVINASGVWGQHICNLADIELQMFPSKGSMLIIDYRTNRVVVNRCRPPADGDIVVPGDTVSLIGTTSRKISYDKIEELTVNDDEIDVLLEDGEKLIPNVKKPVHSGPIAVYVPSWQYRERPRDVTSAVELSS